MPRLLAVALLALALVAGAACGGGSDDDNENDDAPSLDEIRRAAARACTEHAQTLMLDLDMPNTPAQRRRLLERVDELESALLQRLDSIDARAGERRPLASAIAARRAALAARRDGIGDRVANERMRLAFGKLRIRPCGGFGASAFPGGRAWVRRITPACAATARLVRRAARRLRVAPAAARPRAYLELSRAFERFDDFVVPAAPNDPNFLEDEASRQMTNTEFALTDLAEAIVAGDRRAARELRQALLTSVIRGDTAWDLLDVPACERVYRFAFYRAPPAIAGRITSVSDSPTGVSRPWSTRTSSSLR